MPGVPNPERMMLADRCYHSREAGSRERLEAIQVSSERGDTLSVLADYVVSRELLAEEEHRICAEGTVTVRQATFRDAIAGISALIKDIVTALVSPKGHN